MVWGDNATTAPMAEMLWGGIYSNDDSVLFFIATCLMWVWWIMLPGIIFWYADRHRPIAVAEVPEASPPLTTNSPFSTPPLRRALRRVRHSSSGDEDGVDDMRSVIANDGDRGDDDEYYYSSDSYASSFSAKDTATRDDDGAESARREACSAAADTWHHESSLPLASSPASSSTHQDC
jgi:hypothetical protein